MTNNIDFKNYEIFSKKISDDVDKKITEQFSAKDVKFFDLSFSNYLPIIFWIFATILSFGAFVLFGLILFLDIKFTNTFIIISSVFLTFALILILVGYFYKKRIERLFDFFQNPLNIEQYYNYYSNLFMPEISFEKINYNFNEKKIMQFSLGNNYIDKFTNVQFHGFYKNYSITLGTQTVVFQGIQKTILQTSNSELFQHIDKNVNNKALFYQYVEHLFLIVEIDPINFETKIFPETKWSLLFKRKNTKTNELESKEFEKKFKLDYDNPIKLRKLLSPKVMANLIDLSENQTIPEIGFLDNNLILHKIVNKYKSPLPPDISKQKNGYFVNIKKQKFYKKNNIKEIIKKTIIQDFDKINEMLEWVNAFRLHSKYELDQFKTKIFKEKVQKNGKQIN